MGILGPSATEEEYDVDKSYLMFTGEVTNTYQEMEYMFPYEKFVK
jgi:hypothetical protein